MILIRLLLSGLPLILCLLCVVFLWNNQNRTDRESLYLLQIGVIFCTLLWLCLYAEHYTVGSMAVFDFAAPIMSFISLIFLPVVWFGHLILQLKNRLSLCRIEIISTYLLFFVSLIPGVLGVMFFILIINSDR